MNDSITVVIPAFNEEAYIDKTLTALRTATWYDELITVDDGSTDQTAKICEKYSDIAIHLTKNEGKSKALQAGWKRASGDIIVCLDADVGETVLQAEKLLAPFTYSFIDVVIGRLPQQRKRGFGLVKKRAQQLIFKNTRQWLTAPLSGQRAFRKKFAPLLIEKEYEGYSVETMMTIDLLKAGAIVVEVDVDMEHRQIGKNVKGFLHRGKQWIDLEKAAWRV